MNGSGTGGNTPEAPDGSVPAVHERSEHRRRARQDCARRRTLANINNLAYYGHPNPTRDEYVVMGGNPTSNPDPYEFVE